MPLSHLASAPASSADRTCGSNTCGSDQNGAGQNGVHANGAHPNAAHANGSSAHHTLQSVHQNEYATALLQRLNNRSATIGVLGMGYVGLPLGVAFAEAGFRTIGFDPKAATVELLQRGESHIGDIECKRVHSLRQAEKFRATTDFEQLKHCDVMVICVPTPLTDSRDPDLAAVRAAVQAIAKELHPSQMIVLESTTYPGTTDEVARPILEANGLVAGDDFFLAFSPERIDPGNANFPFEKVPKVVGGFSPLCGQLAQALYGAVVEKVVPVSSTRAAELTKLLENIFRSVNIALVNEMALLCDRMGIDVWEVIDAAATKPYGFTKFSPGPGLGGHCIPIDPYYLAWKAREYDFETRFIQLAGEINRSMPHYVIDKITRALNDDSRAVRGSRIAILGMSYKPNVGDCRESPSLRVAELLMELGANVIYHDPYVATARVADTRLESQPMEAVLAADCIVLLTDHREYDYQTIAASSSLIVDTRNAFKDVSPAKARIVKL